VSRDRQQLGRLGEELARRRLEALGYVVLATNYRAKSGEIDLVAEHEDTLVFIEVRTRRGGGYGLPEESLSPKKRSNMVDAAQQYLEANEAEDRQWRIDLVAVEMDPNGRLIRVDVLKNVIEL
jgi:putative endonuclease